MFAHLRDLLSTIFWCALPLVSLALMIGQVYRPWVPKLDEVGAMQRRVSVINRLRIHRLPLLAVVIALGIEMRFGPLPMAVGLLLLVMAAFVILIPVSYTINDAGIALGRTPMRRWTEFAGLRVRGARVWLLPVVGLSRMTVWVGRARGREDFVLAMRAEIRSAYRQPVMQFLAQSEPVASLTDMASSTPSIA